MNIRLTSQPLPAGFCALTDAQWQTLLALVSASITDTSGFINVGAAQPEPDLRDYPWLRLNADGSPDRIYYYWSGLWLSRHPLVAPCTIIYKGTVASVPTYDGGEAAPAVATPTSGPMWEVDSDFAAKFALGAGTLPSGLVVASGATGGEETHQLIKGEMPEHAHYLLTDHSSVELFRFVAGSHEIAPGNKNWLATSANQTDVSGNDQAHNTMPPYYTTLFIKRTARVYYRV